MRVTGFDVQGDDVVFHSTHGDAIKFAVQNSPFREGEYEVKRVRKQRSLDSNSYLWLLCTEIADTIGISKEEVYRRNIREGGEYTPLPIKQEAVDDFSRIWQSHGIGWFCDVVDNSKIPGYKLLFAYHGSSEYDSKQMSLLIDRVKADAESVGIETLPPEKLSAMMNEWGA
jgi:hypothetical protein